MKLITPNIGIRLGLGFAVVLVLLAATAWFGISNLQSINDGTNSIVGGSYPKVVLSYKMLGNVNANARSMRNMLLLSDPEEINKEISQLLARRQEQEKNISQFEALIKTADERALFQTTKDARGKYGAVQKEFLKLAAEGKRQEAITWLLNDVRTEQDVFFKAVDSLTAHQAKLVQEDGAAANKTYQNARLILLLVAALSFVLAVAVAVWITRSITKPVSHLVAVMQKLARGDVSARAHSNSSDEIGKLARQFDTMVDEREASRLAIEKENEQLNDSVLLLLQAVAQLATKDLTVRVPVSSNVTGAVSDALNLLTSETSKVLQDVINISADVTEASMKVKAQSDTVMAAAAEERIEVEHTTESDRKSTRLNSSHIQKSRMPSSA